MSHKVIVVVVLIFLSFARSMAQSGVPARITQPVDEQKLVRLSGNTHPLAQAQFDRGAAPDDMPLGRMHLLLKRSPAQESALRQLISDTHRPGSASYHKWLTPEQFGEQFGASDRDIATVASWLGSHGFQVGKVQPGKQVLEFSGNVAQLRDTFHAQVHKYVVNGETHHASANDPQIPEALAPVIGGFVSLNNFRIKSNVRVLGKASYDTQTHGAAPEWTYGTNAGVNFLLAPADYAIQYDLSPLYTAGTNGSNQTIAIVNDSNIDVNLVNQFRSTFGLSANPPQVIIDGNDPGIDGVNSPDGPNFDSIEAYLDVEWSGAVAPAAQIDLVIGADTALEAGLLLAMEHAVYGNIAPVISVSFGFCEAGLGSTNSFFNGLWEQAAAQGTTVVVSTGDSGSASPGCDNDNTQEYAIHGLGVNGIASTPYNVAVGGTDFFYSGYNNPLLLNTQIRTYWNTTPTQLPQASLLQVIPEQPWNDSQFGLNAFSYYDIFGLTTIAGGSGGASGCATGTPSQTQVVSGSCAGYAKPSWQTGTGVPADGVRDLPDVSLFAADNANFSFYPICAADGDCQPPSGSNLIQLTGVGGTSASTPSFAGIMALVNQKYGRQGQAGFVLYPLKAQFPAAFHDVLQGTNSVPCDVSPTLTADCIPAGNPITTLDGVTEGQLGTGSTPDYNAAAGYNLATGLGTIDANVLVNDWGNIHFSGTSVNLTSPTGGSVAHGSPVTFAGAVTATGGGTPTGNVAIETDSTEPVNQGQAVLALSSGSFNGSINFLPGGTYNVWANYGGDATNAPNASSKVQITVTPEASTTYFNVLNVATPFSGTVAINPGATNVPYGTQLILAAQPVPTTFYNQCIIAPNPPPTCNSPSFTFPTGTVTFADNGNTINTAAINAEGDAEYNSSWSLGPHSVTARYSGDASYNASSAPAIPFTIAKNTPTVRLTAGAQSGALVYTAQVENSANLNNEALYPIGFSNPAAAPTGSVTVTGFPPGTTTPATLSSAIDPLTYSPVGVATIAPPTCLSVCTYNVTINYPGDANYNAASGTTTLTIEGPGFTVAAAAATVAAGGSGTTTITVTPNGAMVGTVTVTCAPGSSPPGVTCDPLSIAVNGSGPFSGQLTVHVAAPSTPGTTAEIQAATRIEYAGLQTQPVGRSRWWKLSAGTGLAAIFLFIVPGRRRYRITLGLWLICVLSLPIGCGGGGGGGVVGPIATATKITAPTTKAAQGAALTFNVAVTAAGAPSGNGTVQLLDGGNVVATASAVNGVATFTNITSLGPGTHTISAHYSGDTSTQASQSGGVNVTVTGNTTVGIATNPASSNSNATISLTIN